MRLLLCFRATTAATTKHRSNGAKDIGFLLRQLLLHLLSERFGIRRHVLVGQRRLFCSFNHLHHLVIETSTGFASFKVRIERAGLLAAQVLVKSFLN